MKFYTVSNDYVNFLKTLDPKVPDNYGGKRPYVGIIIEIGEHKYLAPMTSYKPKQDKIKDNNSTIYKIFDSEANKLGMLHLNNMIPIVESEIFLVDFSAQDHGYKSLLVKQMAYIKSHQDAIKARAEALYNLVVVSKNEFCCKLSCDFSALEAGYKNFV